MKIKLLKAHRHAGINHNIGDVIDVDSDAADWLANLKVATPAGGFYENPKQGKRGQPSPTQAVVVPESTASDFSVGETLSGE